MTIWQVSGIVPIFSDGKTEAPAVVEFMLSIHEGLDPIPSIKKEEEEGKEEEKLDMVVQICNPRDLETATGDLRI